MEIFQVTAHLVIRFPDGSKRVMAEKFRHPEGLLFFEPFWHESESGEGIHLVRGAFKGEGPWKVGECVITVAGCQGSDPAMAMEVARWQEYLTSCNGVYVAKDRLWAAARARGVLLTSD